MSAEQQNKTWSQIVAEAWANAAFKKRLLADPAAALKEQGIDVPQGVQVKVVQDTAGLRHLVLPCGVEGGELSEEALAHAAGGMLQKPPPPKP